MKFTAVQPDENYPLCRAVSETGRWELGLVPMIYGVRVRAGLVGDGGCTVDYCAGADRGVQTRLLALVHAILCGQPEGLTHEALRVLLPTYARRPINLDPVCWGRLCELAADAAGVGA
jgi:hypothetical protein